MSILIPSTEPGVFAEPETPMTYNPALDAFEDTEGYVYGAEAGAWQEAWSQEKKTYLYKDGIISPIAGNIFATNYRRYDETNLSGKPSITFNNTYLEIKDYRLNSNFSGTIFIANAIDFSRYNKIIFGIDYFDNDNHNGNCFMPEIADRVGNAYIRVFRDEKGIIYAGQPTPLKNIQLVSDISSVNRTAYLAVCIAISNFYGNLEVRISKIWLE